MGTQRNANTWDQHMGRNATADKAVPRHGAQHLERGARLDAEIQRTQAARRTELAKRPVVNPSSNPIPALTNAPKLALPPSLKKRG